MSSGSSISNESSGASLLLVSNANAFISGFIFLSTSTLVVFVHATCSFSYISLWALYSTTPAFSGAFKLTLYFPVSPSTGFN